MSVTLHHGDALDVLRGMADASVDAVVTDPPYGLSDHDADDVAEALASWLRGEEYHHGRGGFMGRDWDNWVPSPSLWREVYRVLKPGGYLLCFAGTRTQDLMGIAIRLAGFECRDTIGHLTWVYGSGFPKSQDVSKAIDLDAFTAWLVEHRPRMRRYARRLWSATDKDRWAWRWCQVAAARWGELVGKREVVGEWRPTGTARPVRGKRTHQAAITTSALDIDEREPLGTMLPLTAPATDAARRFSGFGTAMKPAHEPILVFRKPLVGTVAANVQRYGTGALHIEACRVGTETIAYKNGCGGGKNKTNRMMGGNVENDAEFRSKPWSSTGRFPANLVLSHAPGCERVGTRRVRGDKRGAGDGKTQIQPPGQHGIYGQFNGSGNTPMYGDADGLETVEAWACVDGCAVKALAKQSGVSKSSDRADHSQAQYGQVYGWAGCDTKYKRSGGHNDTGTAARFFPNFEASPLDTLDAPWLYTAKASRREREAGLSRLDSSEIIMVQLHQPNNSSGGATWASAGQRVRLLVDTGQSQPKVIGGYGIPSNVASEWNTFLFGSDTTGLSRTGIKSITATATNSTTTSPTWNYLMRSLTNASIAVVNSETASGGSHADDAENSSPSLSFTSAKMVSLPGVSDVPSGTRWTISVSAKSDNGPSREAASGVSVRNAHPT